jgi:phosphoribosylformylglycinamidine synthase
VDLEAARRLIDLLVAGAERGLFRSAHDCSQGGLGVALAEVAMGGPYQEAGFGMDVDLTTYGAPLTTADLLFSESHGRVVITCAPQHAAAVTALAQELGVPAFRVAMVGDPDGSVRLHVRDAVLQYAVARLREVYFTAIPRRMGD